MPNTANYNIPIPTIAGDGDNWGNIQNNNTFAQFDSIMRENQNNNIGASAPTTAQAGSFWINNTNADSWEYQVYDGEEWVLVGYIDPVTHEYIPAPNLTTNVVVFTTTGTYTPSEDLVYAIINVQGDGGGGTSGGGNGNTTLVPGAGGGAGGFTQSLILAASLTEPQTVTIGTGGAGGAAPSNSTQNAGASGTGSSVGTLVTAHGGGGGTVVEIFNPAGYISYGGLGGTPTTGNLALYGGNGFAVPGFIGTLVCPSGNGGDSYYRGGGLGVFGAAGNNGAANTGSGGSGGAGPLPGTGLFGFAGGNGAAGSVTITEYLG